MQSFLELGEMGSWEMFGLILNSWGCCVVGGFLVEIDSYAIALLAMQVVRLVTRWGLFLVRGVQSFFLGL